MKIIIKDPCSENWNDMTPNEQGRFCDACQKTVIDFSKMSDLEIYHALHDHKGKICGRLTLQQIENFNLAHQEFPSPSNLRKWSLAAMLAGVMAYPSLSQPEVNFQNALASVMPMFNNNLEEEIAVNESINTPVDTIVFSGKVVDKRHNQPIAGATVQVEGTNIFATTDKDGMFKISVLPTSKTLTLTADSRHYDPTTKTVRSTDSKSNMVFVLEKSKRHHHIMGGIGMENHIYTH